MATSKKLPSTIAEPPKKSGPAGGDGSGLKMTIQMGTLVLVSLVVAGILWIRDTRSAASTGVEDQVWEHSCGPISSPLVTTVDLPIEDSSLLASWKSLTEVGPPAQIEASLPAGTARRVRLHGGFTARLKDLDYGTARRMNLAYAFEMQFRRTIESNNGRRIVELRQFGRVRMVKITSPAEGMRLALGSPTEPTLALDNLPFGNPGEGMSITAPTFAAAAVLKRGADEVAASSASRAFLEEHVLSGKSVRLTYVDGVGLESIEPLGWTIPKPSARYLFSQPASLSMALPYGKGKRQAVKSSDIIQLAGLSPAPISPFGGSRIAVERISRSSGERKRYRAVFVHCDDAQQLGRREPQASPSASRPMGELRCDGSGTYVAEATVQWPLGELDSSAYRLLHETAADFQDQPALTVMYHCVTEP